MRSRQPPARDDERVPWRWMLVPLGVVLAYVLAIVASIALGPDERVEHEARPAPMAPPSA